MDKEVGGTISDMVPDDANGDPEDRPQVDERSKSFDDPLLELHEELTRWCEPKEGVCNVSLFVAAEESE